MPRNEYGRFPAARPGRGGLTRRALLGAAAVVSGAGLADLVQKSSRGQAAARVARRVDVEPRAVVQAVQPRVVPIPATPPTSSPPTVQPTPHHSTVQHVSDPSGTGGHGKAHRPPRVVEHVDLPPARVSVRSRPIYYVDDLIPDAPTHAIALTVDDGPDPEYTPKVLRLLDRYRMQASFCVVGAHADAYPRLIRDIAKAGHAIVNHSYTHVQPFNRQTEQRVVNEITRTQHAVEKAAKVTPQLFRAPGGDWSPFIFRAVAAYDLIPLDWDVDPMDWAMPGTRKIERAMLRGRPNDIVLCHDGGGNRTETVRALRTVLPDWKHRGYTTIPLVVPTRAQRPASPPATPTPTQSPSSPPSTQPSQPTTSPSP